MNYFFWRKCKDLSLQEYHHLINSQLNVNNLEQLTKKQIKNFFVINQEAVFLAYRFWLLKKWININEAYTSSYLHRLSIIIDKLFLSQELNSYEQQYIIHIQDIVFAKNRNLKNLIIDFSLEPKEKVYYKYSNVQLYEKRHQMKLIENNCEIYISNKRIIVLKNLNVYSVYFAQIKNFLFSKDGLTFLLTSDKNYFISCEDNYVLYVSLERILKFIRLKI